MAAEILLHPPKDQLMAFGLGKLNPPEAAQVELHLEQCADCCETLLNLEDDTFAGLVRKCKTAAVSSPHSLATLDLGTGTPFDAGVPAELPPALRTHGRYEILELIGRGGMGDVYKAQHKVMNRLVALKVIKPRLVRNEAAVLRFRREVQAAASLHHRHIVTAHDAEQAGDLHFLVMEFVAGVNLDEVVRERGPLPVAEACRLIEQAAEGLQHAHERGMVHRDIKPHNLMITREGEVKILDFGLAGFATEVAKEDVGVGSVESGVETAAALHQLTQMGTMMGTPDYIAPEQAGDAHSADIRADIYSLGCTLYTLLAGAAPFGEGSVKDKLQAHREQVPPPFSNYRDDVPAEVEAIVRMMMAKAPGDRYQTPQDVVDALTNLIDARIDERLRRHGIGQPPIPEKPRTVEDWYGRPVIALLLGLTCLVFAMAAVFVYLKTNHGTLVIETDDPRVTVAVDQEGKRIRIVGDERSKKGPQRVKLRVGEYELKIIDGPSEMVLSENNVVIHRGGEQIVQIRYLPKSEKVSTDTNLPSKFFQTLGDLQAIVRKTVTDAGLNVSRMNGTQMDNSGGSRCKTFVKVELMGEQEHGGKILAAFRDKFKGLSNPAGAFISSLDEEMRGNVQATNLPYTADAREGLIRVELEETGADKRQPKVVTWSLVVRLEEWPRTERRSPKTVTDAIVLERKFSGHKGVIAALRYLPGAKEFASLAGDGTLRKWSLQTQESTVSKVVEVGSVSDGDISADGRCAALAAPRGGITRIWDIQSDKLISEIRDATQYAERVIFSPDGRQILLSGTPGLAKLCNSQSGEEIRKIRGLDVRITGSAFSSDGRTIALTVPKEIQFREAGNGQPTGISMTWSTFPDICCLTAGEKYFAAGFVDGQVFVNGIHGESVGRPLSFLNGSSDPTERINQHVRHLEFFDHDRHLLITYDNGVIHIGDLQSGKLVAEGQGPPGCAREVALSADRRYLLAGGGEVWDEKLARYEGTGEYDVYSWQLPKGLWAEAAGESLPIIATMPGHTGSILDLAWSRDGKWIASAASDHTVLVWDAELHKIVATFPHREQIAAVAFSPDSRWLATGTVDAEVTLRELENGAGKKGGTEITVEKALLRLHDLAFSPDGTHILCCGSGASNQRKFAAYRK